MYQHYGRKIIHVIVADVAESLHKNRLIKQSKFPINIIQCSTIKLMIWVLYKSTLIY